MRLAAVYLSVLAFSHGVPAEDSVLSPALEDVLQVSAPVTGVGGTKTNIWSTTQTSTTFYQFINPRRVELVTTKTVTSLETPWASTLLPATVTETVISHITWETRETYLENSVSSTSTTSSIATVHDTWLVHAPQKTDLPAGQTSTGQVACGSEATIGSCDGGPPDPLCQADGLRTAC